MPTPAPAQQQQPTGFSRWVPSLPTINLSSLNPFVNSDDGSKHTNNAPLQPTLSSTSLASISQTQSNASLIFPEPDTRSTSEADSREGSIEGKQRAKKNKAKTRYSVCHPAPASSTRQKLHRRPRSLLQLHKLCPDARPLPAFEVIPSSSFSVRMTRAITRVFRAKHGLCPNDLVVLRAEKYSTENEEGGEAEALETRNCDIIGLICKGRGKDDPAMASGKAKICMASGQEWEAYPLANGGYEFFSTDEHGLGLTVRWVVKRPKDGRVVKDSKRFNFSTISPNSRRHPVIASLSRTGLEVNETYKMPDPSAATPLSTPKQKTSILADTMTEEESNITTTANNSSEQEQCQTDNLLRELITLTGIWVTFKEGWSPSFKYDDATSSSAAALARTTSSQGVANSPTKSTGVASPISTPPGSPRQLPQTKRAGSIKSITSGLGIMRHSSLLSRTNTNNNNRPASQASLPEEHEVGNASTMSGRSRGDSTSTVLVHRAASNRRKNNQATWRPDLLDAQEHPVHETSREDLGRTPPPPTQQLGGSAFESPATPTPARPTLAATDAGSSPTKRVSSATTDTSASEGPVKGGGNGKDGRGGNGRRRRGWRKLFCGGGGGA